MKLHDKPVLPKGFSCASRLCGLKKEGKDLTLFASERSASAAGVFTRNHFPGAPIVVGRERIRGGRLRAIVVNSKVSNVGTGEAGIANARRMGAAAAKELGIPEEEVLMSSTGVIAKPLPIEMIERGIRGMSADLQADPMVGALGIMTTDTHPKALSMSVGPAILTAVAKGSGMVEPNMATMLVYLFTDAEIAAPDLDRMLRDAVDDSFNMLSVDTDTSTSDTCVIMANGIAGRIDNALFSDALRHICRGMTRILARDGEGATKLLTARVCGAATRDEARTIAKSIINSPLIKTMAHGADPNIGRILMAVGKCFDCRVNPGAMRAFINGTCVFENAGKARFDEDSMRKTLAEGCVEIMVDLGIGNGEAMAYGCDLSEGYIEENGAYYSS